MKLRSALIGRARPLAVSLIAALAGCRTPPAPPPFSASSAAGVVYAEDRATALRFAAFAERAAPEVRAALAAGCAAGQGARERAVDVRVVRRLADGTAHGLTFEDWIEIQSGTAPEGELFILAHELAHYFADDTWKLLPHALEEGLADWIAMQVDPEQGLARRSEHLILLATATVGGVHLSAPASTPEGDAQRFHFRTDIDAESLPDPLALLALSSDDLAALQSTPSSVAIYAVGWFFVERIGLARLRGLCESARAQGQRELPVSWILSAAQVPSGDLDGVWSAARAWLGPAEQACILERALGDGAPKRR